MDHVIAVDKVELCCLGTGDAFGSGGRLQPCFLLRSGNDHLLLECGASSLTAIKLAGVNPSDLGWVLISHFHGDHFGGLPFLILDGQFSKRTRPLVIAGPAGIGQRVQAAMEVFFPGSSSVRWQFPVEFIELNERVATSLGPSRVTAFPVRQPSGGASFAFRVELGGKVLAYSGDTEWIETLKEVARGADLFLCEAYFFEKNIPYHLSYKTLLQHRGELDCAKVIMTHMHQDLLDRLNEAEIEPACDGLTILL